MDFLLNPTTNDLDMVSVAGDVISVDGVAAVAQQIRIRFLFFLGEWFLDTRQGVPWFQEILRKNPSRERVTYILRQVILTTPRIVALTHFSLGDYTATNRAVSVSFRALLDTGEVLNSSTYGPFVIDLSTLV